MIEPFQIEQRFVSRFPFLSELICGNLRSFKHGQSLVVFDQYDCLETASENGITQPEEFRLITQV